MKNFFNWLFNRVSINDRFRLTTDLYSNTELIATVIAIKNGTVVYTVSINGKPDSHPRINSVDRFKKIYKERL